MHDIKELAPPPTVQKASRAMELARIWIVDKKIQFCINGKLWDDPGAWGVLLVDLIRHVTKVYENQGRNKEEVQHRIRKAFEAELDHPTDEPEQLL